MEVAITGAGGFIGSHLARFLAQQPDMDVRVLYRRAPAAPTAGGRLRVLEGDLTNDAAMRELLSPGCAVVNCAYDSQAAPAANLAAAQALAAACRRARVARLVHCSTAVVAGSAARGRVDESTPPRPRTQYEKTKLAVEAVLAAEAASAFDLAILRPTAVFGSGGRNLAKLAENLMRGPRLAGYLRSCLQDRRRMNLVSVENVVAAVAFLLRVREPLAGEVFIVSDDDAPANNYRDVERILMRELGIRDYRVPRLRCPPALLALLLAARGRSLADPRTAFTCEKLLRRGFRRPQPFESAVAAFAQACASASPLPQVQVR